MLREEFITVAKNLRKEEMLLDCEENSALKREVPDYRRPFGQKRSKKVREDLIPRTLTGAG